MTRIVGLGAGGHGQVVRELVLTLGGYVFEGFLDADPEAAVRTGMQVLGSDSLLEALQADGIRTAFNGVGGFGEGTAHRRVYEKARAMGVVFPWLAHPSAVVAPSARLGSGTVVCAQAVVNTAAELGENVIVNTAASVDHHCVVGAHAHLAPGVRLAGGVHIGEGAQLGRGSLVREGVRIGARAVVGAGAVVLEDVPEGGFAVGIPAELRQRGL